MLASRTARWGWPCLALLLGIVLVTIYDRSVADARYRFSSDSASYLEMATAIADGRWPTVVPWGLELPLQSKMAQPLFPPGFPAAVALLSPIAGGVKPALLLLPRVAAQLLPLVILLAFRGALPDATLLVIGVGVLATRGVGYWHYIGYSDVPALLIAVAALGTSWQASARRSAGLAVLGGMLAGLGYCVRNAGLAVIGALCLFWLLTAGRDRRCRSLAIGYVAGLLPFVALLKLYDLAVFGTLNPYTMPPSSRGLALNVVDWLSAQVGDLELRAADAPALSMAASAVLLAVSLAVIGWMIRGLWRSGAPSQASLVTLLWSYVALGGALTVMSRTVYEWGGIIDDRHALQYTFAILLAVAVAIARLATPMMAGRVTWGACAVTAMLLIAATDRAQSERREPELLARLAADPALIAAVRDLPAGTFIASNNAPFLRVETGRAVRQSDFGGSELDFVAHLSELGRRLAPRPVAFLLVCEPYTATVAACAGRASSRCEIVRRVPPAAALCRTGSGKNEPAGGMPAT